MTLSVRKINFFSQLKQLVLLLKEIVFNRKTNIYA